MNNKFYRYFTLLAALFAASACVQEEESLFGLQPSERIDQAVAEYRTLLTSAENGWTGHYYPEANYSVGGYAMYFKFDAKNVDVACEIATKAGPYTTPAGTIATSEWTVDKSQGPVLSFYTFNPVLNHFSYVAGSADLDGLAGDYEFVVVSVSDDRNTVTLRGKKRHNLLVLHRNAPDFDPQAYLAAVARMAQEGSAFLSFKLELDGTEVGEGTVKGRSIGMKWNEGVTATDTKLSFAYTDKGLQLYQPVEVQGVRLENFELDVETGTYTCTDPGVKATLQPFFADDFQLRYNQYLGEWTLEYETTGLGQKPNPDNKRSTTVTILPKEVNRTFTLSAPDIFDFESIEMTYSPAKGAIGIEIQYIDYKIVTSAENSTAKVADRDKEAWIRLRPITDAASVSGSSAGQGVIGHWNKDEGGERIISLESNGVWSRNCTGFVLYLYEYGTSTSLSSAYYKGNRGGAYFTYLKLIKKN